MSKKQKLSTESEQEILRERRILELEQLVAALQNALENEHERAMEAAHAVIDQFSKSLA
mgnify:CR=1 FL=1